MATFDQLSPEQRAIVELVLRQGKTYSELAEMLDLPEPRVRELARDALVELAPVSVRGVEEDWRGQLADYVLGQQAGPEATATKGHLRRSEAARSWARSLLDSLEQFYDNVAVPAIPEGERGRGARRPAQAAPAAAAATPRDDEPAKSRPALNVTDPIMRRRLLAGAGALALVLLALFVWPVGLLSGDDEAEPASADNAQRAGQNTGTGGQQAGNAPAGAAVVLQQKGKKQLLVQAARLPVSGQNEGYYVWLYNSPDDAKSLGAQVTDEQGNYRALGDIPADFADYRYIDVTRQAVGESVKHSGESVLRGPVPKLRNAKAQGNKVVALGQTLLRPPQ